MSGLDAIFEVLLMFAAMLAILAPMAWVADYLLRRK